MKIKQTFLLAISFMVLSCGQNQDKKVAMNASPLPLSVIQTNAESQLQTILNDPKSYEFVSLTFLDTITYLENIIEIKKRHQKDLEYASNRIKSQREYKTNIPSMFNSIELQEQESNYKKDSIIILALDSIEKSLGSKVNDRAAYLLQYKFRNKNAMGAIVLNDMMIQVTAEPEYKILNITDDIKKLYHNPNAFPGFDNFSNKYYN